MPKRNDDDDNKVKQRSNWMVEEKKNLPNITTAPSTSEKGKRQQQQEEDQGKSLSMAFTAFVTKTEPREQKDHQSQSTTTTSFAASTATTTNTADSNPYAKNDPMEDMMSTNQKHPFPSKLHMILNEAQRMGYEDIVSWDAKGTSFRVHKPSEFCVSILVRYFRQSKYESFTRQCE
jgi:hypothetical protein